MGWFDLSQRVWVKSIASTKAQVSSDCIKPVVKINCIPRSKDQRFCVVIEFDNEIMSCTNDPCNRGWVMALDWIWRNEYEEWIWLKTRQHKLSKEIFRIVASSCVLTNLWQDFHNIWWSCSFTENGVFRNNFSVFLSVQYYSLFDDAVWHKI